MANTKLQREWAAKVTHYESPSCIFLRIEKNDWELEKLRNDLNKSLNASFCNKLNGWSVDEKCVAFKDGDWHRGIIQKINVPKQEVQVFLYDSGLTKIIALNKLREIDKRFLKSKGFAMRCHIYNIRPPEYKDGWTKAIRDFLGDIIWGCEKFYLVTKGSCEDGSYPIDLLFDAVVGGALEPSRIERKSIRKILLDQNFAIENTSENHVLVNMDKDCPLLHHVTLKHTRIAARFGIQVNGNKPCLTQVTDLQDFKYRDQTFSRSDVNENKRTMSSAESSPEKNNRHKQKMSSWIPATLPTKTSFKAKATYVDYHGCVYLHDIETQGHCLEKIRHELSAKYKESKPDNYDTYWEKKQQCIVQYYLDNDWYRGEIVNTDKSPMHYKVKYVDYGNEELVTVNRLRKILSFKNYPLQCYRCQLHGVQAKEVSFGKKWPLQTLNWINNNVVDFVVDVVVKELPDSPLDPIKVQIYLPCGENLSEKLVAAGYVDKIEDYGTSDDSGLPSRFVSDEDSDFFIYPYKSCPVPDVGHIIPVTITNIEDPPTRLNIQRKFFDMPQDRYEKTANEQLNQLYKMNKILNRNFTQLRKLCNPKPGDAVCCYYSDNNCWYRGLLLKKRDSAYLVLFVDYGYKQWVEKDSLRCIPEEFKSLPMQMINCELHQVVLPEGAKNKEVVSELSRLFEKLLKNCHIIIKESSEPVKVDFVIVGKKCELAYKELIDRNLIKLVREKKPEEIL